MRLTRCYVPGVLAADSEATLPPGPAAHLARVLRLRAGAPLILFDGRGGEYEAIVQSLERDGAVRVRIGAHRAIEREAPLSLILLQCLVRNERMDWIVQKATELGVAAIVPLASRHAIVRLEPEAAERKRQHWLSIAVGACEQCGRNRLPQLHAVQSLEQACRNTAGDDGSTRLVLDPEAGTPLLQALPVAGSHAAGSIALLVGPEGGLGADELALLQRHGFVGCRLGPRVLRAETAPLAALAAVQALLGDFGRG
jgi:16S rRNA (uracil1498-N3)-methyltransferase